MSTYIDWKSLLWYNIHQTECNHTKAQGQPSLSCKSSNLDKKYRNNSPTGRTVNHGFSLEQFQASLHCSFLRMTTAQDSLQTEASIHAWIHDFVWNRCNLRADNRHVVRRLEIWIFVPNIFCYLMNLFITHKSWKLSNDFIYNQKHVYKTKG